MHSVTETPPASRGIAWHALPIEEVLTRLSVGSEGLTEDEAARRLKEYGPNLTPKKPERGWLALLIEQFASPLMIVMALAVVVSFFIGNLIEAIFILVVMASNAIVGFYQEHKANQSLRLLNDGVILMARVVRASREREIPAADLVPGDVIVLRTGDIVPADARLLVEKDLKISEAALTGESVPVEKNLEPSPEDAETADRTCMAFSGTLVEDGSATAVVTTTGSATEYGDIVRLLSETDEEPTPLQKMVIALSTYIGVAITLIVGAVIVGGILAGLGFHDIFESALALFVSAVPEGLLPGITIVLVLGMRRIHKRKGLVRRLAATETLGGVTVICTDKTGTLTLGAMRASALLTAWGREIPGATLSPGALASVRAGVLATDAFVENPGAPSDELIVRGNLTERALLRLAAACGIDPHTLAGSERVAERIYFSSELKYSASLRLDAAERPHVYAVGASEAILPRITGYLTPGGVTPAAGEEFDRIIKEKDALAQKGLRIIACAVRSDLATTPSAERLAENLTLVGFIVIEDPVRPDVHAAFERTKRAGIRTVVVTGDHAATASAVASAAGIPIPEDGIMEGHEIEELTDDELRNRVRSVALFARVSPRHKLRIVHALQENGEVVAMLGDGINDAPALKLADIGVAVDTRVSAAREVADIVLLDGGFGTVVAAIEQGRIIFANIRRVFLYLITQDFSQFLLFIVAIMAGLPLPVLAVQLLLINLVESGLPDLALTTEEEKEGLMDEPPRSPKESVLNGTAFRFMIGAFIVSGGIALGLFLLALRTESLEVARSMTTAFLCLESLFLAYVLRSFRSGLFRKSLFSNPVLNIAVGLSLVLVLVSLYVPGLSDALSLAPLGPEEWTVILLANAAEALLLDRLKLILFRPRRPLAAA